MLEPKNRLEKYPYNAHGREVGSIRLQDALPERLEKFSSQLGSPEATESTEDEKFLCRETPRIPARLYAVAEIGFVPENMYDVYAVSKEGRRWIYTSYLDSDSCARLIGLVMQAGGIDASNSCWLETSPEFGSIAYQEWAAAMDENIHFDEPGEDHAF